MAGKKNISLSITPEEIMNTGISKSKDGYNHAYIAAKRGDGEYVSISYEWKGEGIPDFAMDMMSFMQANKEEIAAAVKKNQKPADEEDPDMMDDEEEEGAKKDKSGGKGGKKGGKGC